MQQLIECVILVNIDRKMQRGLRLSKKRRPKVRILASCDSSYR